MNSFGLFVLISLALAGAVEFQFSGINLSGMDVASGKFPGRFGWDFNEGAKASAVDSFKASGFNTIRLPFNWRRLQWYPNASLDITYLGLINSAVSLVTSRNMSVVLDLHAYGQGVDGLKMTVANDNFGQMYDIWNQLAWQFKNNSRVIFGLMNEPNGMSQPDVLGMQNAGIAGIRDAGSNNLIFVSGGNWDGVHSWVKSNPNMTSISDPLNYYYYEMHQYFDSDSSGTHACNPNANATSIFAPATKWLRDNKKKAFIGEFGTEETTPCLNVLTQVMTYLKANSDVWIGWTWWTAGPWYGTYMYNLDPATTNGRKQLPILQSVLPSNGKFAAVPTAPAAKSPVISARRSLPDAPINGQIVLDTCGTPNKYQSWMYNSTTGTISNVNANGFCLGFNKCTLTNEYDMTLVPCLTEEEDVCGASHFYVTGKGNIRPKGNHQQVFDTDKNSTVGINKWASGSTGDGVTKQLFSFSSGYNVSSNLVSNSLCLSVINFTQPPPSASTTTTTGKPATTPSASTSAGATITGETQGNNGSSTGNADAVIGSASIATTSIILMVVAMLAL